MNFDEFNSMRALDLASDLASNELLHYTRVYVSLCRHLPKCPPETCASLQMRRAGLSLKILQPGVRSAQQFTQIKF